ncbi:MAG: GCN5-related N-acetyltransferase [Candidatus Gottesmanbacteria bacterium GW2011_GWB1_43_11]|uniref:GCN5-related N-acetyltransferase n=1 Tax=Candidatus Gottesmanbacteria bacterium GW2011_GWB1_43_11 TaxID=1618446 RepID=A0A0G1EVL7_9BACT|nr:MAG: GCN5-related N-acetyltransferase [Candidatus Gottesmanbacteria bacterium GW2011_GWB1_43_11]
MRFVETPGIGTTLIQLVDDQRKLLSRLEVLELTIWFSGVKIPVAGIAGVYTPPGLRKKGYATNCLKHAIRKQQRKDKCLLMLFGERDFYARFGLTPIGPWYGIYVSQKLAALPPEPLMRDCQALDQAQILNLYTQNVKPRIGAVVRDPKSLKPFFPTVWRNGGVCRVLIGSKKQFAGYVWHSAPGTSEFEVVEVGALHPAGYDGILAYLLHETKRRAKDHFLAALPPDDPFTKYLMQFEVKQVVEFKPNSRSLARILDLKKLLKLLTPVFKERVRLIKSELVPRTLMIKTGKSQAKLDLAGTYPGVELKIEQTRLTQLLFGTVNFDLQTSGRDGLNAEIGALLFPKFSAFTYLKDRF